MEAWPLSCVLRLLERTCLGFERFFGGRETRSSHLHSAEGCFANRLSERRAFSRLGARAVSKQGSLKKTLHFLWETTSLRSEYLFLNKNYKSLLEATIKVTEEMMILRSLAVGFAAVVALAGSNAHLGGRISVGETCDASLGCSQQERELRHVVPVGLDNHHFFGVVAGYHR